MASTIFWISCWLWYRYCWWLSCPRTTLWHCHPESRPLPWGKGTRAWHRRVLPCRQGLACGWLLWCPVWGGILLGRRGFSGLLRHWGFGGALLHFSAFHCISLYFTLFICIYLYFTAFHCIPLHFSAFLSIFLHFSAFHCIPLNVPSFLCISHYFSLFLSIFLHFSAFFCTSPLFSASYILGQLFRAYRRPMDTIVCTNIYKFWVKQEYFWVARV